MWADCKILMLNLMVHRDTTGL